jgi:hypothetical protein
MRTRDLGWKLIFLGLMSRGIKHQTAGSFGERHILLMEEGSPLKRGTVKNLTATAMTEFGIERLSLPQAIGHSPAHALPVPSDSKLGLILHFIRWAVLQVFVPEGIFWVSICPCWTREGLHWLVEVYFCNEIAMVLQ